MGACEVEIFFQSILPASQINTFAHRLPSSMSCHAYSRSALHQFSSSSQLLPRLAQVVDPEGDE